MISVRPERSKETSPYLWLLEEVEEEEEEREEEEEEKDVTKTQGGG